MIVADHILHVVDQIFLGAILIHGVDQARHVLTEWDC